MQSHQWECVCGLTLTRVITFISAATIGWWQYLRDTTVSHQQLALEMKVNNHSWGKITWGGHQCDHYRPFSVILRRFTSFAHFSQFLVCSQTLGQSACGRFALYFLIIPISHICSQYYVWDSLFLFLLSVCISLSVWLFSSVQDCLTNRVTLTLMCLGLWSAHASQPDADGMLPYHKMWFTGHQVTLTMSSKHGIYSSLNNWIVTVLCHLYYQGQVLLKCVDTFLYLPVPWHAASSRWQTKCHLQQFLPLTLTLW